MELADLDPELTNYDLDGALDFLDFASQQGEGNHDGLRELFADAESEAAVPRGESSAPDVDISQADAVDEGFEDCNNYNQSTARQASLGLAEAINGPPLGSEGTSAPGEAHLEVNASNLATSSTPDSLYYPPEKIAGQVHPIQNDMVGFGNILSQPPFFHSGYNLAPTAFSAPQAPLHPWNMAYPQYFGNQFSPYKLPGSIGTHQKVALPFAPLNLEENAGTELALQPHTDAISSPATQHPASWKPFADVLQGRIWVFGGENGRSAASLADTTFPRTPQEKRTIADKLRVAYESAQPSRHKREFLLLDWTCLELVDEVCLFHAYGPLTKRYLSGMPKLGPRHYDTYSDHIDDLIAVIGRQNCPKAQNLRKRMIDVTHRKRLVDNPQSELGLVKKNEAANKARKLRHDEKQAKAAALESENASLKAQLKGRSPAGAGIPQDNAGAESNQWPLDLMMFRGSSEDPSVQRSAPTLRTRKRGSASRAESSFASSSENTPPDLFNTDEDDYGPTSANNQGCSASKKVKYSAHTSPGIFSDTDRRASIQSEI